MVHALIFAGGTGRRMNPNGIPKQFLKVYGRPIIALTLEIFENSSKIDNIIVVCVEKYLDKMRKIVEEYKFTKVKNIIPGGETGQRSIWFGLERLYNIRSSDEDIVLIHDGVRPIIDEDLILRLIESVQKYASAISTVKAYETLCITEGNDEIKEIIPRNKCLLAKAPQGFFLNQIYNAHVWANNNKITDAIDSADLYSRLGKKLHAVESDYTNIKITYPVDYYILKGILDSQESSQIIGI